MLLLLGKHHLNLFLPPRTPDANPTGSTEAPAAETKTVDSGSATENNGTLTNGHTVEAGSIANGTGSTASPPKSPAPAPASDTPPSPAPPAPVERETPATAEPTPAQETKPSEDTAAPSLAQAPVSTTPAVAETPADSAAPPAQPAAPASATDVNMSSVDGVVDAPGDKMAVDGAQDAAPMRTELPHHPSTEAANSALPPLQTDQEMKDAPSAPLSPSKVSREREVDPADEPAAKRTKTEGENGTGTDYKVPELRTPAAETPGSVPAGGESGITKMQHKYITKCLSTLKRMHDSRFYREAVDPIKLNIPSYHTIITQPMDLGTMEKKLKAGQYPSPQAVADDFALMVRNAVTFNGPEHLVSQEGQKLEATFKKQMLNLPRPDEVEEKKPKKVAEKTSAGRREPRTSTGSQTAKASSPQNTKIGRAHV